MSDIGVDDRAIVRFKAAFDKSYFVERAVMGLPPQLQGDPRVAQFQQTAIDAGLVGLRGEMDQISTEARQQRSGKFASKSSSVKVSKALGDEVDPAELAKLAKGKGKGAAKAKAALAKLEARQAEITDEFTDTVAPLYAETVAEVGWGVEGAGDDMVNKCGARSTAVENMVTWVRENPTKNSVSEAARAAATAIADALGLKLNKVLTMDPSELVARFADLTSMKGLKGKDLASKAEMAPLEAIPGLWSSLWTLSHIKDVDHDADVDALLTAFEDAPLFPNGLSAGRYSAGGSKDEANPATAGALGDKASLTLSGNDLFRAKAKDTMDRISATDAGGGLLAALKEFGGDIKIQPTKCSSTARVEKTKDGDVMRYAASGGAGVASVDPDNMFCGDVGTIKTLFPDDPPDKIELSDRDTLPEDERWRVRSDAVATYHEMLHALIGRAPKEGKEGISKFTVTKGTDTYSLMLGATGDETEMRIVGLPYDKEVDVEGRKVTFHFPFDDPSFNPLTENQFRIEEAKKNGEKKAYLRWKYANLPAELAKSDRIVDLG